MSSLILLSNTLLTNRSLYTNVFNRNIGAINAPICADATSSVYFRNLIEAFGRLSMEVLQSIVLNQDSVGPGGVLVYRKVDTHFFKGTVPWGPCPAPFLASVTRQATILYAESSSTMLHNYVNQEFVQFHRCMPSVCVARS